MSLLNSVASKIRLFLNQTNYLPRTFRIIWEATGTQSSIWLGILCIQGILPAISLYLIRWLVDNMVGAVQAGGSWENLQPVLIPASLIVGIMVLTEVLISLSTWLNSAQSELIADHLRNLLHKKIASLDLMFFELPEYHDRLERVRNEASTRPLTLLHNFGGLLRDTISILSVGIILISYGLWFPIVLFASTLPAFAVVIYANRQNHQWWEARSPQRRWADYYDGLLTQRSAAAEVRLFGLSDHFITSYREIRKKLRHEMLALIKRQNIQRLGTQLLSIVLFGLIISFMAWRAIRGVGTLGDVALFFQAFSQGQSIFQSLLRNIGNIYRDVLFLGNLFEFLDTESTVIESVTPHQLPVQMSNGIKFSNVSFRYPGSADYVLKEFNLFIPAGKVVAIVGSNGAGKSTLLKLLCRFYDPSEGRIEIDGIDLRNFKLDELHKAITVIFQSPLRHSATVSQNIAFGDQLHSGDLENIEVAAQRAGAHQFIANLPDNYETLLGKNFTNGHELSGGEWQRLALSRAYFRRAPIILLDEPTSQLDSWSEVDWYTRFRSLASGHTAIIITHRFTLAKDADIICVMDQGQIVESGTHEELLAQDSRYAASWRAQTLRH